MVRSRAVGHCAFSSSTILMVPACTDNGRLLPFSTANTILIPPAANATTTNFNISDPTLTIADNPKE